MRPRQTLAFILSAALVAGCAGPASDDAAGSPLEGFDPTAAEPTAEHRWLAGLVGTWQHHSEADMGPDAPPMVMTATEVVRPIGDMWIQTRLVNEGDDMTVTGAMTLGFDPATGRFLGTWVDSSGPRLWTYDGQLEDDGRTLALYAEGPDFSQPGETRLYRDATTLVSPDLRRSTSSMQAHDGSWVVFMNAEARRIDD